MYPLCRSIDEGDKWEGVVYPGMKQALVHVLQVTQDEIEHRKVGRVCVCVCACVHVCLCVCIHVHVYICTMSIEVQCIKQIH